MHSEDEHDHLGEDAPPPDGDQSPASEPCEAELSECERLRERVRQLEEEQERERKLRAEVTEERDEYLKALYNLVEKLDPPENWGSFRPEDYTVSGEELLQMIEAWEAQEQ